MSCPVTAWPDDGDAPFDRTRIFDSSTVVAAASAEVDDISRSALVHTFSPLQTPQVWVVLSLSFSFLYPLSRGKN